MMFRNSTHSNVDAGSFRKSTYSNAPWGGCIEAGNGSITIAVRDTTQKSDPDRTTIEFPAAAWRRFIDEVANA